MIFNQSLQTARKKANRRRFLALAATAAGGWWAYRWWRQRPQALRQRPVRYITPLEDFYKVAIYLGYQPDVNLQDWRLSFGDDSGTVFELGYPELLRLPSRRVPKTFMCIENPVGGDAIGNAEWTVTPLAPLLERLLDARPQASPTRVLFRSRDGFFSSVPLDVGLDSEAGIAYQMNGRRLPRQHGFPARVLLPSKYGMKQPKWLERIEVTSRNVGGYWENQGWSDQCDVRMTSRIDRVYPPSPGLRRAGRPEARMVEGVAYCGGEAVEAVEVSDDDQKTWQQAELTSPSRPNAWSTWRWLWQPSEPGGYVLTVRTRDASGRRQQEGYAGSFPSGSAGLHKVFVEI